MAQIPVSVPEKATSSKAVETKSRLATEETVVLQPAKKAAAPFAKPAEKTSKFSINAAFTKKEEIAEKAVETITDDLPENHFTETDLHTEWDKFLEELRTRNPLIYNAIHNFALKKEDENTITIKYPSASAKAEFEKIQQEFLNHFKRKVSNFKITVVFKNDVNLKKEVVTKRKIFDKFAEINPVLKDLNDLMKFDLT